MSTAAHAFLQRCSSDETQNEKRQMEGKINNHFWIINLHEIWVKVQASLIFGTEEFSL